jgi:hypothetical protein
MITRSGLDSSVLAQQPTAAAIPQRLFAAWAALVLLAIPWSVRAASSPGEVAARSLLATALRAAKGPDFKVLVWYRKTDSLGTFKFEIYDLRKGEYTPQVDAWIKNVQTNYPAYYAAVRDVDLKREKGATDLLKVGKVINRELVVAASLAGIAIGSGEADSRPAGHGIFGRAPAAGFSQESGLTRSPSSARLNRDYLNRSTTAYPIPVPILNRPR